MVHLLYFHFLSRADITKRPFKLHLYLPFCNPLSADAFLPAITICAGRERVKEVDISGGSGIINYAKVTDVFDVKGYSENSNISLQKVVDLLEETEVGRTALSQLLEKGVKPIFDYSKPRNTNRGEQQGNIIKIYVQNIASERVTAQTVVHETTHLYYNIGQNQWAEAVCFAKEKMFLTGRPLTVAERRYIVRLAKDNYLEFKWKKGGYGYGK